MTPPRQLTLDAALGRKNWQRVSARLESEHAGWVELARQTACQIIREKGQVTADDVIAQIGPCASPPVHGTIFKNTRAYKWLRVGVVASKRPASNSSIVSVWRIADV